MNRPTVGAGVLLVRWARLPRALMSEGSMLCCDNARDETRKMWGMGRGACLLLLSLVLLALAALIG